MRSAPDEAASAKRWLRAARSPLPRAWRSLRRQLCTPCWLAAILLSGQAHASPSAEDVGVPQPQPLPAGARGASEPRVDVWVLTFGPGDHPFSKFGHNALWVHDEETRTDLVFNYGTYRFDSPYLILDFLKSRFKYWVSVQGLRGTIDAYEEEDRSVHGQKLRLTPAQGREVRDFLRWNAQPENRVYAYDYYRDNCSTRVRDVVDKVAGGALHAASRAPASMTWRAHTMRLTADNLPVYFGLYASLTSVIDQPIDQWDEMFLPSELERGIARATIATPEGALPLVETDRVFVQSSRTLRAQRPSWTAPILGLGALFGVALALLGKATPRSRLARVSLGMLLALLGISTGVMGSLFTLLWGFTNHDVAYHNENLFICPPWTLLLVFFGLAFSFGKVSSRWTAGLVTLTAATSLVGVVAKVLPGFNQDNAQLLAFFVPVWCGAAAAVNWARRGHLVRPPSAPSPR